MLFTVFHISKFVNRKMMMQWYRYELGRTNLICVHLRTLFCRRLPSQYAPRSRCNECSAALKQVGNCVGFYAIDFRVLSIIPLTKCITPRLMFPARISSSDKQHLIRDRTNSSSFLTSSTKAPVLHSVNFSMTNFRT